MRRTAHIHTTSVENVCIGRDTIEMMEYQVPQFIEVEDKIIGPFTLKQFIYLAGGIGVCVVLYVYLPFYLTLLFGLPVAGFALALAFYKVNGKPFIEVLEAGFAYYTGNKLFLWRHQAPTTPPTPAKAPQVAPPLGAGEPRLTRGKLSELAWSLDVKTPSANEEGIES